MAVPCGVAEAAATKTPRELHGAEVQLLSASFVEAGGQRLPAKILGCSIRATARGRTFPMFNDFSIFYLWPRRGPEKFYMCTHARPFYNRKAPLQLKIWGEGTWTPLRLNTSTRV